MKIDEKYHFHFLSPNSYDVFFDHLRNGKLIKYDFKSDLEDKLWLNLMNNADSKAIYICNSHKSTLDQKLQKSMSCQRLVEMKMVANLKNKMIGSIECQCLTKAICNAGKVLILKFLALNKISSKLKNNCFKIALRIAKSFQEIDKQFFLFEER